MKSSQSAWPNTDADMPEAMTSDGREPARANERTSGERLLIVMQVVDNPVHEFVWEYHWQRIHTPV